MGKDKRTEPDDIGFGGLKLYQSQIGFRYGLDAVLLCHFAYQNSHHQQATTEAAKNREKSENPKVIIDLCSGNGIVPIILASKGRQGKFFGVEIQETQVALARKSIKTNNMDRQIEIIEGDVRQVHKLLKEQVGMANIVTMNPPYVKAGAGIINEQGDKKIARHEIVGGLEDFLNGAYKLLKDKGKLFMVHRPNRLADIVCGGRKIGLEPKLIQMVHPRQGEAPNIMLVGMVKNGGHDLKIQRPLTVREKNEEYTDEIQRIYGNIW